MIARDRHSQRRGSVFATLLLLIGAVVPSVAFQITHKLYAFGRGNALTVRNTKVTVFSPSTCLRSSENNNNGPEDEEKKDFSPILKRFVAPRIDDVGLPLADVLVAQVVGPSFQIFWLGLNQAPLPSWLRPIGQSGSLFSNTRGSLLAPALIHGAGLACCWLTGALAARAYESDAFNVSGDRGYALVVGKIIKAGAFAIGILILATQADLLQEFGRYVQPGNSAETDFRLFTAAVEVINDVVFEAVTIGSWRLYRASLTAGSRRD